MFRGCGPEHACCLVSGMCQSWPFLWQMAGIPGEPAGVGDVEFLSSCIPPAEKADVNLAPGPQTEVSDRSFYLLHLPVGFVPQVIFSRGGYLLELMTREEKKLCFSHLELESARGKGIASTWIMSLGLETCGKEPTHLSDALPEVRAAHPPQWTGGSFLLSEGGALWIRKHERDSTEQR